MSDNVYYVKLYGELKLYNPLTLLVLHITSFWRRKRMPGKTAKERT